MGGAVATHLEWHVTLWLSEEWKEDLYECIATIHRNDLVYPWITLNFRKMERRKDSMRHCEYDNDSFLCSQDEEDDELNDRILIDGMSHLSMVDWLGMLRYLRLRTCPKSLVLPTLHGQGRVNAFTVRADGQFLRNTMYMSRNHLCFSSYAPTQVFDSLTGKACFLGQNLFTYAHSKWCFRLKHSHALQAGVKLRI